MRPVRSLSWFVACAAVMAGGCGQGGGAKQVPAGGYHETREATLGKATVNFSYEGQTDPKLTWIANDANVFADFGSHKVNIRKKEVVLDGKSKPLSGASPKVAIAATDSSVTITVDGKNVFGAAKSP